MKSAFAVVAILALANLAFAQHCNAQAFQRVQRVQIVQHLQPVHQIQAVQHVHAVHAVQPVIAQFVAVPLVVPAYSASYGATDQAQELQLLRRELQQLRQSIRAPQSLDSPKD